LLDWIAALDSEERCQANMQDCMYSGDVCLTRSYGHSWATETRCQVHHYW